MLTALLMGLAGSLHCVGMCSPLVTAVSVRSNQALLNRLLYNAGRVLVYGALGFFVGGFGALAGLTSYQTTLSAGMGIGLVLLGITGMSRINIPIISPVMHKLAGWLRTIFGSVLQSRRRGAYFLMGAINGLLPCGLTYFALTYCLTVPNGYQGFAFMVFFGVGTLPAMLGIPGVIGLATTQIRGQLRHATAIVMIGLGALLLVRSLWVRPGEPTHRVQAAEVICP